jgi:trimethylamine--corrinoid protein Co-methyltransferase
VLSQLKREGSPFLRSKPGGDGMDMRSMVSLYGAPDGGPFGWDLAHSYGIPTFGAAGCSDAKVFDAQAAAEATLTLFDNIINGANLIHDVGYLGQGLLGNPAAIVMCDEIISYVKRFLRGFDISREKIGMDTIRQVGPGGNYMTEKHTLRNFREEIWVPKFVNRDNPETWVEKGSKRYGEVVTQKARAILATHQPEPLPEDVLQELDRIARKAEKALENVRFRA